MGEPLSGERSLLDPEGKLCYGGEGDIFVICRQRTGIDLTADELIVCWTGFLTWQNWIPLRIGSESRLQGDFKRPRAPLVKGRHANAPTKCCLSALGLGEFYLHEFFCFGEGFFRN